jgi:hypothetical protein
MWLDSKRDGGAWSRLDFWPVTSGIRIELSPELPILSRSSDARSEPSSSSVMMRIPLINTKDSYAIVDNSWYALLTQYNWRLGSRRYAETDMDGRTTAMHNVVLPPQPGFVTDHKNGIPLDNRRQNLRLATPSENAANRVKLAGTSSNYYGVSKTEDGRYRVDVSKGEERVKLGPYDSEIEAAVVHDIAAFMLYGYFASLNFPEWFPQTDERR